MKRAVVVVPTKNEGPNIKNVIRDIREGMKKTPFDDVVVLIVDDSRDDTRKFAMDEGAIVVKGTGDGLGIAMYRGLKSALMFNPQIIVAVDGDGQSDCSEIPRFVEPVVSGEADMVLGSRFLDKNLIKYKYKFINRFGTIVLSWILRRQTGLTLTDSHGGLRAMRPEVVNDFEMLGSHTYVQETIIDAAQRGYRIKEIPSIWKEREHGSSRVVGSIPKYIFYTLPILILRSGQHIRLLYSSGIFLEFLALALFGLVVIQEGFTWAMINRTPAFILISMLVLMGLQFFFFGFVLQLLKQIKQTVDSTHSTGTSSFADTLVYDKDNTQIQSIKSKLKTRTFSGAHSEHHESAH